MKKLYVLLAALCMLQQAHALIVSVRGEGEVPEQGLELTVTEGEEDILTGQGFRAHRRVLLRRQLHGGQRRDNRNEAVQPQRLGTLVRTLCACSRVGRNDCLYLQRRQRQPHHNGALHLQRFGCGAGQRRRTACCQTADRRTTACAA